MTQKKIETIQISEMFGPTIQGEGHVVGKVTYFVRTGGCDWKCSFCDSLHAVLPEYSKSWTKYTTDELLTQILNMTDRIPSSITLSGGNPAIQPLGSLIGQMKTMGYTFSMETQGTISKPWFSELADLIISPKPPSSGMRNNWQKVADCINAAGDDTIVSAKFVIMDEDDYEFAKKAASEIKAIANIPIYLSIGNDNPPHVSSVDKNNYGSGEFDLDSIKQRTEWLVDRVAYDSFWMHEMQSIPIVLPQVHTLLWGNKAGV